MDITSNIENQFSILILMLYKLSLSGLQGLFKELAIEALSWVEKYSFKKCEYH
jgi:hypothetical protein